MWFKQCGHSSDSRSVNIHLNETCISQIAVMTHEQHPSAIRSCCLALLPLDHAVYCIIYVDIGVRTLDILVIHLKGKFLVTRLPDQN